MKLFSNLRNKIRASLIANNRGQGATEYILLLVVVVSLVIVFKDKIKSTVQGKTNALAEDINSVTKD